MSAEQNPGVGPLIGSIIIVLILLLGGYYSLKTIPSPAQVPVDNSNNQPVPVISAPIKPPQASTEIKDIEADAKDVNVASLDSGLENLDLLIQ
ncbi:MAG: hypothetical protein Q7S19_03850 [bacterium]|nr:hypothetical protein [bacterium]